MINRGAQSARPSKWNPSLMKTCLYLFVAFALGAYIFRLEPAHDSSASVPTPPPLSLNLRTAIQVSEPLSLPLPLVHSAMFTRHVVDFSEGKITIVDREMDPFSAAWHESKLVENTSFAITGVTTDRGNNLYVAGIARNGDTVIEKWMLPPWQGGWHVAANVSTAPLGLPFAGGALHSMVQLAGGGPFSPPTARGARVSTQREEIHRGSPLNELVDLRVEPHGRFLYVLAGIPRNIWVLDLNADSPLPVVAFAPGTGPSLLGAEHLSVGRHVTLGRCFEYLANAPGPDGEPLSGLLIDSDEDGYLDGWFVQPTTVYDQVLPRDDFLLDESSWFWVE